MQQDMQRFIVALCCVVGVAKAKFYSTDIARERLITDLFVNYEPSARPARKGEHVALYVNVELQHFDFRERDGAFHLVGLLDVQWRDPKLVWNPRDYNNLTRISVNQKAVWVPDLEVYNNAPDKFLITHRNGVVLVQHNGSMLWSNVIEVNLFCTNDMHNWPHDSHHCEMNLGSWTFSGYDLDIVNDDFNTSLDFDEIDMKNTEYKITNFTATHNSKFYKCCPEPYVFINYDITFQRRSAYVVIFRAPALCIILLTLLSLAMEPGRPEKIWLNGIAFLLVVFQLIYFARSIGHLTRTTPLIVVFFSTSLVIVTLAQLAAVFSLLATRSLVRGRLPSIIEKFLKNSCVQYIAPTQAPKGSLRRNSNPHFEEVKLEDTCTLISSKSLLNDWYRLAKVVERMALAVFAITFVVLSAICFV